MNKSKKIRTYSLDELTDKYIGKRGLELRENFEYKLSQDLLVEAIKRNPSKLKSYTKPIR